MLLLNYDGTLAPFQVERDRAYPYPGIIPLLDRIRQSGRTQVFVISGRPACEVQALLNPLRHIEIWGAHGLDQLLTDGTYQGITINSDILETLAQAEEWLREADLSHIAETKPGGVAVHWRGLSYSEIERVKARTCEGWDRFADNPKLKFLDFDGGIELRAAHPDKGDAVSAILGRAPLHLPVAFLGDDYTDEDAFRALGDRGFSVLVRPEYRETRANAWFRPPEELIGFLQQWSRVLLV